MQLLLTSFRLLAACGLTLGLAGLPTKASATLLGDLRVTGCVHLAGFTCSNGNFFELMPASAVTGATEFSAMADVGDFDLLADLGTTAAGTDFLRLTVTQRSFGAPALFWQFGDLYGPDQIISGVSVGGGTLGLTALTSTEKTLTASTASFSGPGGSRSLEFILGAAAAPAEEEEEEEEDATPVPAPSALLLLVTGLATAGWRGSRRCPRAGSSRRRR